MPHGNTGFLKDGLMTGYFCDLTQEELSQITLEQGGYILEEWWITEDVRVEHKSERWLNVIIRKSNRKIK